MEMTQWLRMDPEANYCYVADGANAQQKDILAQLLYRRNKETGKLESMAMSIDEIIDKSADGQQTKYKSSLASIADAWNEAAELGLLDDDVHPAAEEPRDEAAAPETAEEAHDQRRKALRAKITDLCAASTMNDRAATARKAARLARGGNGNGGDADVVDDPTCAHHAVANIGEGGRKAIDKVLHMKMAITNEQAESEHAAKVKALRTSVGWFSSPACSLIYQTAKYVALFSSKGYAIGANFAQWLAHKLKTTEQLAGELIAHVEDLLAICGGRDYVFYLDAAVVERFSQLESLYGYLLEEADLGAEAGGKLRKAIIMGFESVYCMAAVRSMAIIADAWLWPMLRAIEPGVDVHILDVCPALWPRTCTWLQEAAMDPQSAIDGTLSLRSSLEAAGLRTTPSKPPTAAGKRRAERAAVDLQRIRAAIDEDAELRSIVQEMLSAAFTAMAAEVRNHAAEFMPGGAFCTANLTAEIGERLEGMPTTSVGAETMFARVKRRAERGGISRHDTRMGAVVCNRDKTVLWGRTQTNAEGLWRQSARSWRSGSGSRTMKEEEALKGAAKAPEREAKLSKKRKGKAAKAAELERLKTITLVAKFSGLKRLRNDELSDQLKIWKLVEKKDAVKKTTGNRPELVRALQPLILERFGAGASDLEPGDDGCWGQGLRRRRADGGAGGAKRAKKGKNWVVQGEWEWDSSAEFIIERLLDRMVADGATEVPGRTGIKAGTVLYKVLWEGWPEELATWEAEDDIPCGEVDFVAEFDRRAEAVEQGDVVEPGSESETDDEV